MDRVWISCSGPLPELLADLTRFIAPCACSTLRPTIGTLRSPSRSAPAAVELSTKLPIFVLNVLQRAVRSLFSPRVSTIRLEAGRRDLDIHSGDETLGTPQARPGAHVSVGRFTAKWNNNSWGKRDRAFSGWPMIRTECSSLDVSAFRDPNARIYLRTREFARPESPQLKTVRSFFSALKD